MFCPELFLKIFSVLGLRKMVIIKAVVEALKLRCIAYGYIFGFEHCASKPVECFMSLKI